MARVQSAIGRQSLPLFFSGHHEDGTVARFPEQPHIAFQSDLPNRLLVITPDHFNSTNGSTPKRLHELLDAAVTQVRELRAGGAGLLQLTVRAIDAEDEPLFSYAQHWESVTPYTVNRHRRVGSPTEALMLDAAAECVGLGLPEPRVSVAALSARSGSGLMGTMTLEFPRPVRGPLLIGRTRYLGGGLFRPVETDAAAIDAPRLSR
jgi:CRISPR-associated protein Csb2